MTKREVKKKKKLHKLEMQCLLKHFLEKIIKSKSNKPGYRWEVSCQKYRFINFCYYSGDKLM